ncbi:bifunctional riboflavin kinase/FAD synthetase [Chloroflexota bacterium]
MDATTELAGFKPEKGTLLTIGVFDGVHLGHKHLINTLTQKAAERNLISGVVTFRQHPRLLLSPHSKPAQLISFEERATLLKSLGVKIVVPLTFTAELAKLNAREFVMLLKQHLQMQGLVIGPDFALGHGREGDATTLKSLGQELDFTVEAVLPLVLEGSLVSSTAIRETLAQGDISETTKLLGRHFSLSGPVVGGRERGQSLGFPTANIGLNSHLALPNDGVYATRAHFGDRVYPSVTNIGTRPTFSESERTIEVHLLDFTGNVYGQQITIELVERLRPEMKFAGKEELIAQINKDIGQARKVLK